MMSDFPSSSFSSKSALSVKKPFSVGRLTKKAQFKRVATSRKKWIAPGFILQVRQRPHQAHNKESAQKPKAIRVGFILTKKIGKAVVRNRLKRRLKAIAAMLLPTYGKPFHDYVIIGRKKGIDCTFHTMTKQFRKALVHLKGAIKT